MTNVFFFFSPLPEHPPSSSNTPAVSNTYVSMTMKTWTEEHEKCICCHVLPIQSWAGSQTCPLKIKQQTYTQTRGLMQNPSKPNRHIVCASCRRCDTLIIISSSGDGLESSDELKPGGTPRSGPFDSSARAIFFWGQQQYFQGKDVYPRAEKSQVNNPLGMH